VVKTFDLVIECARLRWDGRDNKGTSLPSGIYYYNLDKSPGNDFRRMILIK
jgi:flagellar hook assembly protein FlgD